MKTKNSIDSNKKLRLNKIDSKQIDSDDKNWKWIQNLKKKTDGHWFNPNLTRSKNWFKRRMKTNKIYSNKNKQKQRLIQIKNDFQVRKLSSTAGGRTSGGSEKRTIFWGGSNQENIVQQYGFLLSSNICVRERDRNSHCRFSLSSSKWETEALFSLFPEPSADTMTEGTQWRGDNGRKGIRRRQKKKDEMYGAVKKISQWTENLVTSRNKEKKQRSTKKIRTYSKNVEDGVEIWG